MFILVGVISEYHIEKVPYKIMAIIHFICFISFNAEIIRHQPWCVNCKFVKENLPLFAAVCYKYEFGTTQYNSTLRNVTTNILNLNVLGFNFFILKFWM